MGGGNSALQEAVLLAKKCKRVIILQDLPVLTGEESLQKILMENGNVEVHTEVAVKEYLVSDGEVCGVKIERKRSGKEENIACRGVFLAIGLIPENQNFAGLAELDEYGYFNSTETCMTKSKGLFVAGDCRKKQIRQVTTAASDGAVAALAACRYIDGWDMEKEVPEKEGNERNGPDAVKDGGSGNLHNQTMDIEGNTEGQNKILDADYVRKLNEGIATRIRNAR